MNRQLYNKIIHNISKGVKKSLNEDIQNFNPVDYNEDEYDIIDNQTVKKVIDFDYNDFDDIADKFKQLELSQKAKSIFFPILSIYEQVNGKDKIMLWSYNFFSNKEPFVTKKFINTIKYIKQKKEIHFNLVISFNYYNDIVFKSNITPYMADQCMTLLRAFIIKISSDIHITWKIDNQLIVAIFDKYQGNPTDFINNINNIYEGLKLCKEIFNKYLNYLNERFDEFNI